MDAIVHLLVASDSRGYVVPIHTETNENGSYFKECDFRIVSPTGLEQRFVSSAKTSVNLVFDCLWDIQLVERSKTLFVELPSTVGGANLSNLFGQSGQLAFAVFALFATKKGIFPSTPIAATGVLGHDLSVGYVDHINKKIQAAVEAGMGVVFYPEVNNSEIDDFLLERAEENSVNLVPISNLLQIFDRYGLALDTFSGGDPYRGLRQLETWHKSIFFGRESETEFALAMLDGQTGAKSFLVFGESGTGKSSFLRAGVLAGLSEKIKAAADIEYWNARDSYNENESNNFGITPSTWRSGTKGAERAQRGEPKAQKIIVIDPLDQVTQLSPKSLNQFGNQLLSAIEQGCWVFAAVKSDTLLELTALPWFTEVFADRKLELQPISGLALSAVIRGPASRARLRFETDEVSGLQLDDEIYRQAIDLKLTLPVLAFFLRKLYEKRSGDLLTWNSYQDLAGIPGLIESEADKAIKQIGVDTSELAALLFDLLVSSPVPQVGFLSQVCLVDSNTRKTRVSLIEALQQVQLLEVRELSAQLREVRLTHESLLLNWSKAKRTLDEISSDIAARDRLSNTFQNWDKFGGSTLNKEEIETGQSLAQRYDLNPKLKGFVEDSAKARRNRLRLIGLATMALLLVATTTTTYLFRQAQTINHGELAISRAESIAQARTLAFHSVALSASGQDLDALRLALNSSDIANTDEGERALASVLAKLPYSTTLTCENCTFVVSPNEELIAAHNSEGALKIARTEGESLFDEVLPQKIEEVVFNPISVRFGIAGSVSSIWVLWSNGKIEKEFEATTDSKHVNLEYGAIFYGGSETLVVNRRSQISYPSSYYAKYVDRKVLLAQPEQGIDRPGRRIISTASGVQLIQDAATKDSIEIYSDSDPTTPLCRYVVPVSGPVQSIVRSFRGQVYVAVENTISILDTQTCQQLQTTQLEERVLSMRVERHQLLAETYHSTLVLDRQNLNTESLSSPRKIAESEDSSRFMTRVSDGYLVESQDGLRWKEFDRKIQPLLVNPWPRFGSHLPKLNLANHAVTLMQRNHSDAPFLTSDGNHLIIKERDEIRFVHLHGATLTPSFQVDPLYTISTLEIEPSAVHLTSDMFLGLSIGELSIISRDSLKAERSHYFSKVIDLCLTKDHLLFAVQNESSSGADFVLIDLNSGAAKTIYTSPERVSDVFLNPSGNQFAYKLWTQDVIKVVETASNVVLQTLQGHQLRFLAEPNKVIVADGATVKLIDLETNQARMVRYDSYHRDQRMTIDASLTGKWWVNSMAGYVSFSDASLLSRLVIYDSSFTSPRRNAGNTKTFSNHSVSQTFGSTRLDLETELDDVEFLQQPNIVAISQNKRDQEIILYDLNSERILGTIPTSGKLLDLASSNDLIAVLTTDSGEIWRVTDVVTRLHSLKLEEKFGFVTFSRDGKSVMVDDRHGFGTFRFFDLAESEETKSVAVERLKELDYHQYHPPSKLIRKTSN